MPEFEERVPDGSAEESRGVAVTLERDQEGVRVRIVGDLDLATVPDLERVLDGLAGSEHGRLLIDLDEVEFMDSTGLAAIVRAQRSANSNGHRMTLRRGSLQVQRLLELTDMLDRFTFED